MNVPHILLKSGKFPKPILLENVRGRGEIGAGRGDKMARKLEGVVSSLRKLGRKLKLDST